MLKILSFNHYQFNTTSRDNVLITNIYWTKIAFIYINMYIQRDIYIYIYIFICMHMHIAYIFDVSNNLQCLPLYKLSTNKLSLKLWITDKGMNMDIYTYIYIYIWKQFKGKTHMVLLKIVLHNGILKRIKMSAMSEKSRTYMKRSFD